MTDKEVIDEASEVVEKTMKKVLSEMMPQTKKDDEPKYSISEIYNHQKNCSDSNCPACRAMNEKAYELKIDDISKRTDAIIAKRASGANVKI